MLAGYGGTKAVGTRRGRCPALAHAPSVLRGQLELRQVHGPVQGRQLHGAGSATADAGATGLALLCYLAAGQTHKTRGPYRMNIERGLVWLVRHQERDGNLAKGCISPMYSHAMATMALCEAFGLSGDRNVAHGRPGRGQLHHRRPEQERQRLALQSRRPRRHVGDGLADHGPEERPDGRPERGRSAAPVRSSSWRASGSTW